MMIIGWMACVAVIVSGVGGAIPGTVHSRNPLFYATTIFFRIGNRIHQSCYLNSVFGQIQGFPSLKAPLKIPSNMYASFIVERGGTLWRTKKVPFTMNYR